MNLTIEEKLLKHQIEVADGTITVDAAKLRVLLLKLAVDETEFEREKDDAFQMGREAGLEEAISVIQSL